MSAPTDVVNGADPNAHGSVERVSAYLLVCDACTYRASFIDFTQATDALTHHREFAHPAHRNPEMTCQETPPWDHDRWCIRPRGHDGGHWTPDGGDGRWWGMPVPSESPVSRPLDPKEPQ